jgi:RNA polymerase sigma-70 factor (ECF subfamily)
MPGVSAGPVVEIAGLIAAHHAPLYRYAYRLTGKAADAEDLTQQAFLIAQQKLHQLREAERAAGWLFAILRSCYLKWRRKRFPMSSTLADLEMGEVPQPQGELKEIDTEELQQVLADLHEDLRLILLMFYFEELSYKQIADDLEIPIGTVMSRLSRAKQKMRERLMAGEAQRDAKQERRKATVG